MSQIIDRTKKFSLFAHSALSIVFLCAYTPHLWSAPSLISNFFSKNSDGEHSLIDNPTAPTANPVTDKQTGSVNGYIVDEKTDETIVSANVSVKGTKLGAITNKSGFFSIKNIPSGKQTLLISYSGYERQEITLNSEAGQTQTLRIKLKQKNVEMDEVQVQADREAEKRRIVISQVNIPVEQLKQLRIGGEADVFRALQALPGVLSRSQISSGLYVRGGSPDQTLVSIDGATVYNPTHLFGFFSTFNTEAIKDVELIKGGYPAEYGSRLSSVLTLTQKDGNRNDYEGKASIGLISSQASAQGPLGNGSFFIGGRRTYFDVIKAVLPEDKDNPLPDFYFYDVNAKVSQILDEKNRIFIAGFLTKDELTQATDALKFNIGIGNQTLSGRWTHVFAEDLFSTVTMSYSRYNNFFSADQAGFLISAGNTIRDYTGKIDFEWFTTSDLTLKAGTEVTRYIFDYEQNFSGSGQSASSGTNQPGNRNFQVLDWATALYAQANYQFSPLFSAQLGLRTNYMQQADRVTLDPRIALRYQIQENIALKAAFGMYHQYLRLAANPNFSFFDTWLPTDSTVNPSRALQYIIGVETTPIDGYNLNVDLYYKSLNDISEFNQLATTAQKVRDLFFSGIGEAFGLEIFLQKKVGRLTGWVGYAWGKVNVQFDQINQGRWFNPQYDRRHDFKVVAQYALSDTWEVGGNFTLQSGQPFTGVSSHWSSQLPGETIARNIVIQGDRGAFRLPPSHQLNLYANYKTTLFGLPARLMIDIYNVYSRRDIWFRFYDTSKDIVEVRDVRLLPIIPTVSLELKF